MESEQSSQVRVHENYGIRRTVEENETDRKLNTGEVGRAGSSWRADTVGAGVVGGVSNLEIQIFWSWANNETQECRGSFLPVRSDGTLEDTAGMRAPG